MGCRRPAIPRLPRRLFGGQPGSLPPADRARADRAGAPPHAHVAGVQERPAAAPLPAAARPARHGDGAPDELRRGGGRDRGQGRAQVGLRGEGHPARRGRGHRLCEQLPRADHLDRQLLDRAAVPRRVRPAHARVHAWCRSAACRRWPTRSRRTRAPSSSSRSRERPGSSCRRPATWPRPRASAGEHDVLFMADEIQSGLGRTGRMLACMHEQVTPDVLILGKALSGGVYPVSAVLSSREVLGVFKPGDHGSTFGGNPLACAVARAALDVLVDEQLPERAAELGTLLMKRLQKVRTKAVRDIRGKGLWIGVELDRPARPVCERLKDEGRAVQGDPRARDPAGAAAGRDRRSDRTHRRDAGAGAAEMNAAANGRLPHRPGPTCVCSGRSDVLPHSHDSRLRRCVPQFRVPRSAFRHGGFMDSIRTLIMGAAGRDFHNFNVVYRSDPRYQVVGFTAAQIPNIAGRRYPAELAGPLYPDGLPIYVEDELTDLIRRLRRAAGRLLVQRRVLRPRHAPLRNRQRGGRRLRAARAEGHDARQHEAGHRRLRGAHRRRQEPDDEDASPGCCASRGFASRRCVIRCPTATSSPSACSALPRSPTSRATSARSRRSRNTSRTS